jgi:hypothetical protein
VGEDLPRGHHAAQLALVLLAREHEVGGEHAIGQAALVAVDVEQEQVQGGDALDEAVLDAAPLVGRDDARHEVEREDALQPLGFAVHGEGDAVVEQRELLEALAPVHVFPGEALQDGDQRRVVRPRLLRAGEDLVVAGLGGHPVHDGGPST